MAKIQLKLHFACSRESFVMNDTSSNLKILDGLIWVVLDCDSSYTVSDFYFVPFVGAYLVPYLILLLVIGIPLFFLELSVGQRIRRGSIGVWNYISPKLGGIGFASCVVSFFTLTVWFMSNLCDPNCLATVICSWASGSMYNVFGRY